MVVLSSAYLASHASVVLMPQHGAPVHRTTMAVFF
jgi:hypothetical protein